MITVNYYPKTSRLDYTGDSGTPIFGIMGNCAHLRAIEYAMSGNAIIRLCLDSKIDLKP